MCGYKVHAGSVQHIKEGSTAASMMEHIVHTLKRHTGTDRRNKTLSEWQQSVNEVELSGTTHRPSSAEYFFFFLSSFLSGTSCFVHAPLRPAASFASSVNSRAQLCGLCVYIQCIKKGCMCKKKKKVGSSRSMYSYLQETHYANFHRFACFNARKKHSSLLSCCVPPDSLRLLKTRSALIGWLTHA